MTRYSKQQWTDAALAAMAERGTVAINMEQLARELDASKGALYYHFENRRALLEAALNRWEEMVRADIAAGNAIDDPHERLRAVTLVATGSEIDGFVDIALASSMDDAVVAQTVRRVNQLRVEFLVDTLRALGVAPADCEERALSGLAGYLGLYQLQRSTGTRFDETRIRRLLTDVIDTMLR